MAGPNDATGTVTVVSTSAAGVPGNLQSTHPVFSPDGRHVAFVSNANNLVTADTNGTSDIFLKDLTTGAITLVSANAAGIEGDSGSFNPVFSADGTKLAFSSFAGNLVSNDADLNLGIFVKDLATGAVTMVTSDSVGTPVVTNTAAPVFMPGGTSVAFISSAKLTPDDTNGNLDLYLKDLGTGTVTRLSANSDGYLFNPVLSPDGKAYAVLSSSGLTPDASGFYNQLYVRDIASGAYTLVSRAANDPDGTPGAIADRGVGTPVFSPDGSKVAFWSSSDNLVAGDANNSDDLFVKDLRTGAVTLVTASQSGAQGGSGGQNDPPVFSADGTKILFSSYGNFLVPGDTNNQYDVFEKDLITGEVTRLSTAADGTQASLGGLQPALSPDGSKVAFLSGSKDLVAGFTPREGDIFVKELVVAPVNTPPVASDDTYVVTAGTPLAVAASGVLANDRDANGDTLSAALISGPSHGTLALDPSGAFTYTAAAGFHGQDGFTYKASDGQAQSGLATVTLTVDTPPAASDDRYTTRQNVPLTVTAASGLLANDHDTDGDHLTAALVSGPSHGTLALNGDGSFTYTPTTGYVGSDSFTYRDSDGIVPGNVATVSLGVTANFGDIVRVSTDSGNGQIARGGNNPTVSHDGTKVAFWSSSDYAGEGDGSRLYIKDLTTGTATVVWQEATSDYRSNIAFSPDGHTIAFESATGFQVEDTLTRTATTFPHTGTFRGAEFSPNGSQIAFYTDAALMPSDTNGQVDVYILDLPTRSLNRVSTARDGSQGVGPARTDFLSYGLAFSPDGGSIVFSSGLHGLTGDQYDSSADLYIKDLRSGDIRQLTHGTHDPVYDLATLSYVDGSRYGADADVTSVTMSPDGSKVAFVSQASNLVSGLPTSPNPVPGFPPIHFNQVFVLDLGTGQITVASSAADGGAAVDSTLASSPYVLHGTYAPVFSPDSQKIAFRSTADNLVPGDTNGAQDVFVKDLTTGAITRVSTTADGAQTSDSTDRLPSQIGFSPDGTKIVFSSEVDNFVPNDTNEAIDVFLKTIRYPPTAVDDRWSPYAYQPLVIDAGRGVLANDTSPSGSALTATLVSGPAHGTLDFHADGSFTYTDGRDPANPNAYYFGLDQFTYKVNDGISDSNVATVHLGIFPTGGGGSWGFQGIGGSSGGIHGDPHLMTFDGRAYDFQAVGEFALVHGTNVETQVRLGAVGPDASSVTAVATRIGGTVVELDAGTAHPLLIGGVAHDLADGEALQIGHGFVSRAANIYTVVGDAGDGFSAGVASTFLDLQMLPYSASVGPVSGLLGNADGNTANDLALADGTVLTGEVSAATLYGSFADSWRVTDATSLFTYTAGQSTASFTDRSFPSKTITLADLDPAVRSAAEDVARAAGLQEGTLLFTNTVLDIALTGNAEYASAAAGLQSAGVVVPAPEAPGLVLSHDTGSSSLDGITSDAALTVTPSSAGGTLTYTVDSVVLATYDPSSLSQGPHTVSVTQTDAQGRAATSAAVRFTLDTIAPMPSIAAASGAASTVGHVVSGTADAADAGGTITLFDGAAAIGTTASDASGHWAIPIVFDGDGTGHAYHLTAVQTDAAGNTGTSASFDLTLDFAPNRSAFGALAHDAASIGGEIYALYDAPLGRAPDDAGLACWTDRIAAGLSLHDAAAGFLASPEFAAGYGAAGGGSDETFLEHLYQVALGRAPDTAGEAYWEGLLAAGTSRADVALAFALSPENESQIAPALQAGVFAPDPTASDMARLYYGLLDRAPDEAGLRFWTAQATSGAPELSIAQAFLDSPEYAAPYATLSDQAFLAHLYEGALGRSPDQAGLDHWQAALDAGRSRASVALAISESPEAMLHHLPVIEQGWHLVA
ncbi:DUF4214 domain-containing protein [Methylobacterium sp. sgz302541]|uniref:DUF4214 domain-containing protein n=1 Tax=unclassified Methylobacterium TaxID=2615210 RepID=UPI003D33FA79